jgi:uncharacterized membrane protein
MRGLPSTGLKTRNLLAKAVQSCLPEGLPYNWDDKLRELVVGICLSRSLLLQSIAQTRPGHVRTRENNLSGFLRKKRLEMSPAQKACIISALKRMSRRRVWKHRGKAAVIIDGTSYAKTRSRGKKKAMPGKGKVRLHNLPTDDTILVPGYQEIWCCLLLDDGTVLPITRRLWSENGPDCASMNLAEEAEIRRAADIIRETFKLDVILVADSGYRRKELLDWLKRVEGLDFVIRIEGNLKIEAGKSKGLLENLGPWWPKRFPMQWRENSKHVLLSDVASREITVTTESKEKVSFNAVCLTPENSAVEPMYLATTLTTETDEDLRMIVRLYSWRWGIETFFWKFKQALGADSWRVFSCWEAINRLLTAAHMAYVILVLLMEFAKRGRTTELRELMDRFEEILRSRFARPIEEMTLGRFLRLIAMDFPNPRMVAVGL